MRLFIALLMMLSGFLICPLSTAEETSQDGDKVTSEITTEKPDHKLNSHNLPLEILKNWNENRGISPRIRVWREPNNTDPNTTTGKSITLTRNDSEQAIAEQISALNTVIGDLYNEAIIHHAGITGSQTLPLPHLDYEFKIGQNSWRQLIVFIGEPTDQQTPAQIITFTGPATTWDGWATQLATDD